MSSDDPLHWPRSFLVHFREQLTITKEILGQLLQKRNVSTQDLAKPNKSLLGRVFKKILLSRLSVLSAATNKTIRLQTLIVVIIDHPIKTCSVKIEGKHPSIDMANHHEIDKRKRCYFQNQRKDNSRCDANGYIF